VAEKSGIRIRAEASDLSLLSIVQTRSFAKPSLLSNGTKFFPLKEK
jgi:hypothetical protein